jgi:hypothetical protein
MCVSLYIIARQHRDNGSALACADNVIGFFDGRLDPGLVVNRETLSERIEHDEG